MHDVDRSWQKLYRAERLLVDYYDTKFTAGDIALSPSVLSPTNKGSQTAHYGGILNNRNDPKKRTQALTTYGRFRTFDFSTPTHTQQECVSPAFRSYDKPPASALPRRKHLKSSLTGDAKAFEPAFNELVLAPEKVRFKVKTAKRTEHRSRRKYGRLSKVTRGVDTEGAVDIPPQWFVGPAPVQSVRIRSVQRTPASLFLDHIVREQAHRRYMRKRPVVQIPQVKSPRASVRSIEVAQEDSYRT